MSKTVAAAGPMVVFLLLVTAVFFLASCTGADRTPSETKFTLTEVAESERLWTGVAVSAEGRIFVNYPRWSPAADNSVVEIADSGELTPFPDAEWNSWDPSLPRERFVCVQSVHVDRANDLWILDAGFLPSVGVVEGGPKLLRIDLTSGQVAQLIYFDDTVTLQASYLNDVRVDVERGYAYVTDSGVGALIVVNLATGRSRRKLGGHYSTKAEDVTLTIEGLEWLRPDGTRPQVHSDGLALMEDGEHLYYQALTGRTMYRVRTELLRDASLAESALDETVELVAITGAADGIAFGNDGVLYLTSIEHNAIRRLTTDGAVETVVADPRLKWPDSLAIASDGSIYVTTSQIHLGALHTEPYRLLKLAPRTTGA